jgi:histidinol-phosphatase
MSHQRKTMSTSLRSIDVEPLLDLALHMANRADEIALAGYSSDVRVETKPDGSPVTRVDREIESVLRDTIEREHPRAGILGEEYGEEPGIGRWVIDPIDGTREFIAGDPRFSALIAYEIDDEPVLGVVSSPAIGQRWWAGVGVGAYHSYRGVTWPARVSKTRDMARSHGMLLGDIDSKDGHMAIEDSPGIAGARLSRRGVSWEAVRVAGGELDFAVTSGYRWDVAPVPVIVREAGGQASLDAVGDERFRLAVSNDALFHEVSRFGV